MMNGGAPSMSGMSDQLASGDSMMKGFAALGDQGDPMKMASSGAAMPGANPGGPAQNANPTLVPSVMSAVAPTVQKSSGLSNDQMKMLANFIRSRKI